MEDSQHNRMRMNVDGDRLSSLPDDLIHKILSFLSIKNVIETSVWSPRWRFVWTSMPYLNFSSADFPTLPKFSKFVTHVLSRRNNLIEVSSVNLSFHGKTNQMFVKRIMSYACSHNVRQLTVTCLPENKIELPLSVFSSQTLEHLTLTGSRRRYNSLKSASKLPALTTLHLECLKLYDDDTDKGIGLFSKFTNLKNLTLNHCNITGYEDCFNICHPRLSSLTLEDTGGCVKFFNVVAPQLKTLTVRDCSKELLVSAPELAYLLFDGYKLLQISADSLRSLEKLDFCIRNPYPEDIHKIVGLFQHLHSVKHLTLNLEIAELLSAFLKVISRQPSPFASLKSLTMYPALSQERAHMTLITCARFKQFLLDRSPSVTFTVFSYEVFRAARKTEIAQKLMIELRVLLDEQKALMNRNKARTHVARGFVSTLKRIEELMTGLPASKKAMLQPCFSSLRAEAELALPKP